MEQDHIDGDRFECPICGNPATYMIWLDYEKRIPAMCMACYELERDMAHGTIKK